MDASLTMMAARLVGCVPSDVMAVSWQGELLAVVWGIGWKRTFSRAEVDALAVDAGFAIEERVQMVVASRPFVSFSPIEIAPTDDTDGLHTLFPHRLAQILIRAGYDTPGAVQQATNAELSAVNGVGPRALADIRELLPARRHEG